MKNEKQLKKCVPHSEKNKRKIECLSTIARSALLEIHRLKNQNLYKGEEIESVAKREAISVTISVTEADWVQVNYDDGTSDCDDADAGMSCTGNCPC